MAYDADLALSKVSVLSEAVRAERSKAKAAPVKTKAKALKGKSKTTRDYDYDCEPAPGPSVEETAVDNALSDLSATLESMR
jgi:hypothetical protein